MCFRKDWTSHLETEIFLVQIFHPGHCFSPPSSIQQICVKCPQQAGPTGLSFEQERNLTVLLHKSSLTDGEKIKSEDHP